MSREPKVEQIVAILDERIIDDVRVANWKRFSYRLPHPNHLVAALDQCASRVAENVYVRIPVIMVTPACFSPSKCVQRA